MIRKITPIYRSINLPKRRPQSDSPIRQDEEKQHSEKTNKNLVLNGGYIQTNKNKDLK